MNIQIKVNEILDFIRNGDSHQDDYYFDKCEVYIPELEELRRISDTRVVAVNDEETVDLDQLLGLVNYLRGLKFVTQFSFFSVVVTEVLDSVDDSKEEVNQRKFRKCLFKEYDKIYNENLPYLQKATELAPTFPYIWQYAAKLYSYKNLEKAKECINRAYELNPDDIDIKVLRNQICTTKFPFTGSYFILVLAIGIGLFFSIGSYFSHSFSHIFIGTSFLVFSFLYLKKRRRSVDY